MRTSCVLVILVLLLGAPLRARAVCGDGVRDGKEQCDGSDLGGQTCASVTSGFVQGGTLSCNPDCTFNTADCRRFFLQSLIPGRGSPKNRCQLEWTVAGATQKAGRLECSDGTAACDQDKSFNGVCTMTLQLCFNVPDPKVSACTFINQPGRVFRLDVLQPTAGTAGGQQVVAAVLSAASQLATTAGSTASLSGSSASFSPPITSSFACGQSTIHVPLRGTTGKARPGKLRLRARSSDNSGRIRSTGNLTLVCNP